MASTLSKKDFKLIGISSKNPEKVIIELDKKTLDGLISTKKRISKNSLVSSWLKDSDEGVLKSKTDIHNFLNQL